MPSLAVIADVPDSFTLSGDVATSEVQIAKTGTFSDPRYGKFAITINDFKRWIANFQMLNKKDGRLGLPVDIDHGPEKKGETEAAGWITALTVKNDRELWATVEWNSLGKELVSDRRYAYLSPSYTANYKDERGMSHGTALLGVALTNRPFLTMATVSLAAQQIAVAEELPDPQTTNENMDITKILEALGVAADSDEATVLAKVGELKARPEQATTLSVEDQAKAEGKMVLSTDQFASLMQNATEGAAAAKQLSQMTFDNAFDKAVSEGRALPAQKDTMLSLYNVDKDNALKLLESMPKVVNVEPVGAGGGAEATAQLSADLRDDEGYTVEEDRVRLHNKAVELCDANSNLDYGDALVAAAAQLGL